MKSYKQLKESLSHDYILQHLADKDINAHIKHGKVVVHPDDVASARKHLKKIGHDHFKVTSKGSDQVAEELNQEGVLGTIAGGLLGAATGGPVGAIAGAYLGHKVQQGANAAKKTEKQSNIEKNKKTKKLATEEVELDEVLDPSMGAGEYIKDFQKSDNPKFKGKSQEKRRIMGIAAYMAAKREKNK